MTMKIKRVPISLAMLVGLMSLGACAGPCILMPGGALEGPVADAPESWTFVDAVDTVQLETRPSDPYSVNIWVIGEDPHLYVHAGANRSEWVEHMETDPSVRMRIDGTIYALSAERVGDQAEFDRFSDLYERKYGRRPRNENVAEAYLFRLMPR